MWSGCAASAGPACGSHRRPGLSRATVSRILQRLKLNKTRHLEPPVPVVRYEHAAPGDLLHIDIKKFARIVKAGHRITGDPRDETRGAGWEFLYVAVDDHSRIAYTALYPDETAALLSQLPAPKRRPGSSASASPSAVCLPTTALASTPTASPTPAANSRLTHKRTRIYTPRTNGKAERFIQTAIREWAYARRYQNSNQRSQHLKPWTHLYNPQCGLNVLPVSINVFNRERIRGHPSAGPA